MKNLYICNTVYQIIVAHCIKKYLYDSSESVLFISDHTANAEMIVENMQEKGGIFNEVRFIKTNALHVMNVHNSTEKRDREKRASQFVESLGDLDFDNVFFSNLDYSTTRLIRAVRNKNGIKTKISMYEDGLGSYCREDNYFPTKGLSFYNRKYLRKDVHYLIDSMYLFWPQNLEWNPPMDVYHIPLKLAEDDDLKNELNRIFGYDNIKDDYKEPFVFFEDGFSEWGIREDIEVINSISNKIGKSNIFVKTHPRNRENYYQNEGYKTNCDKMIPWEIISMNLDMADKVLLTYYSQAVITPYLIFGKEYKVIILSQLLTQKDDKKNKYFNYLNNFYYSKNNKMFFVPESFKELMEQIKI